MAIGAARKLQQAQTGDFLLLEDAEWEYLKARLSAARFSLVAPEIVVMVAAVEMAEDIDAQYLQCEARA